MGRRTASAESSAFISCCRYGPGHDAARSLGGVRQLDDKDFISMMRFAVAVLAGLALCLAGASSALATTGHVFFNNFGLNGYNGTNLPDGFTYFDPVGVGGLTVRPSNGDVYAADPGNRDASDSSIALPRIERFDKTGAYVSQALVNTVAAPTRYANPAAVAVGPSGGSDVVYVSATLTATPSAGAVLAFSSTLTPGTALSPAGTGTKFAPSGAIAVDPVDGTVYVGGIDKATAHPVIDQYSSTGVFEAKITGSSGAPGDAALTGVKSLAVDGAHHLFVADGHKVLRYSAAGVYQLTLDDLTELKIEVGPVAADPVSNRVYVVEGQVRVAVFTSGGVKEDTFATAAYSSTVGLGVDPGTGVVYTADGANAVAGAIYNTFAGPTPVATTGSVIDPTSETLHGTVNPEGVSGTTVVFEYGRDVNYGTSSAAPIDPGSSGSSPVAVSDIASGLLPNTTYHFRLDGTNANGTILGPDSTFTTAPAAPVVDGAAPFADPIANDGTVLHGTVDPRGSATTYHFDYGTSTAYGSVSAPDGTLPGSQGSRAVTSTISGLVPDTLYHFRVVADNGTGGPQAGADQTFLSSRAGAASASSITALQATFSGITNPRGHPSTYHFEYTSLTTPEPVTLSTAETDAGDANTDTPVSVPSGLLRPGTTYTVRVVTFDTTTNVTTRGVPGTFTTDPAPGAVTGAVNGVTPNTATFTGTYDTHGYAGSYQFVIGSSTSPYLAQTDPVAVTGSGTASGALGNLPAGQTYKVRLAVTGQEGVTAVGDTVTFSTPPKPPVLPPRPPTLDTTDGTYGCTAPVLTAYNQHPKPGDQITIGGSDLGTGGNATLGTNPAAASAWSPNGFTITLPDDATGSLPLTVNCGAVSNTIAIQIYQAPSNTFTATAKAGKSSTVTVSVKVPGPGSITVTGTNVKTATKHAGAAGTSTVKATLTSKAIKSLKRHHQLTLTLKIRFTPNGGTSRTISKSVTLTRKSG